jgi:hypothetical protein
VCGIRGECSRLRALEIPASQRGGACPEVVVTRTCARGGRLSVSVSIVLIVFFHGASRFRVVSVSAFKERPQRSAGGAAASSNQARRSKTQARFARRSSFRFGITPRASGAVENRAFALT